MSYIGQSMSERAKEAYDYGAKPLSKWTKQDILEQLSDEQQELIAKNKISLKTLKDYFLSYDSWHHTAKYYNCTNFYTFDEEKAEKFNIKTLIDYEEENKREKKEKEEEKKNLKIALVSYVEWEGTRKHPKRIDKADYAVICSGWAYFDGFKKSLRGNYTSIVKEFNRAPKGTAKILNKIKKNYRLGV